MNRIVDIVPVQAPSLFAATRGMVSRGGRARASRRGFLRGALGVSTVVGLSVLGFLPPARKAKAGHPRPNELVTTCPGHADEDSCDGCELSTPRCCCSSQGWHKHNGTKYKVREDDCADNKQAWLWTEASCCSNGMKNQKWRCHDGFKCLDSDNDCTNGGTWDETVCKKRLRADECNSSVAIDTSAVDELLGTLPIPEALNDLYPDELGLIEQLLDI